MAGLGWTLQYMTEQDMTVQGRVRQNMTGHGRIGQGRQTDNKINIQTDGPLELTATGWSKSPPPLI